MKIKTKLLGATMATLAVAAPIATVVSCGSHSKAFTTKTVSYADQMIKLASKDITVAGGWGDDRFYAKGEAANIAAIGVTDYISNDGLQVRKGIKHDDIKALQAIFKYMVGQAKKDPKTKKPINADLKKVFHFYGHEDYSAVAETAEIKVDISGKKQKAYASKPAAGSDYFEAAKTGGLAGFKSKSGAKKFKVQFIPSDDPKELQEVTTILQKYLDKHGIAVEVTSSQDYDSAATALEKGTIDMAFLPVNAWSLTAPSAKFILQAGRSVQIADPNKAGDTSAPALTADKNEIDLVKAMNGYSKFNAAAKGRELYLDKTNVANLKAGGDLTTNMLSALKALKKPTSAGYYRGYIWARKDSEIYKAVQDAIKKDGSNWKLDWSKSKHMVKYGYTSLTSASSYIYPEHWFKKHFTGFNSFAKS